jgi:hypothetical protein
MPIVGGSFQGEAGEGKKKKRAGEKQRLVR